ncbi:hypothetical protein HanRHA438_Chr03g0122111 [Helianthus annuus]|nr:hypothetical protein HanHA89_Chr03g0103401 [Helianthus annuus]KAJ0935663.1 hypothetical protein HanRHA438_Chr03g0122111 [Helianthus annuus]
MYAFYGLVPTTKPTHLPPPRPTCRRRFSLSLTILPPPQPTCHDHYLIADRRRYTTHLPSFSLSLTVLPDRNPNFSLFCRLLKHIGVFYI